MTDPTAPLTVEQVVDIHKWGDSFTKRLCDSHEALRAEVQRLKAVEKSYRMELWVNHGHSVVALYGDDGEMQCGHCRIDFKRDPIEAIEKAVHERRSVRAAEALKHLEGDAS